MDILQRNGSKEFGQHRKKPIETSAGASTEYTAYALKRVEVPTSGLDEAVLIPETDLKKPELYRLVLKDKDGKALSRL